MIRKLALATVVALMASPAFADECSEGLVTMEEALVSTKLADDHKAKAGDLLDQAKDKQAAGDNSACVTLLDEARKLISAK